MICADLFALAESYEEELKYSVISEASADSLSQKIMSISREADIQILGPVVVTACNDCMRYSQSILIL